MPRTPLYVVYRTIRSTMSTTGLSFSQARQLRTQTLSRSETGRGILAREERRREQARERSEYRRRERNKQESLARWQMQGFPDPDYSRDYGPTSPYAVVFRHEWRMHKAFGSQRGVIATKTTYSTEIFHQFPTEDDIYRIIEQFFDNNADNQYLFDNPGGESDPDPDIWESTEIYVEKLYISTPHVAVV